MTPIHKPFATDADYLEQEFTWVAARCRHLGARMDAERDALTEPVAPVADADTPEAAWPDETRTKVALLAAVETTMRERIDARLEATREAGVVLGLDHLVQQHDLDELERQILLLASMPACGLDLVDVLGSVGSFSFAMMSITPELVAVFTRLDLNGRLRLRSLLGESGRLVAAGLVEVELPYGGRVQDFPEASIYIKQEAFDVITGIRPGGTEDTCPSCGQTVADRGAC